MDIIVRPSTHVRQPSGRFEIDRASPFGNSAVFATAHTGSHLYDAVAKRLYGNPSGITTQEGYFGKFVTASNTNFQLPTTQFDLSRTWSFFYFARFRNAGGNQPLIATSNQNNPGYGRTLSLMGPDYIPDYARLYITAQYDYAGLGGWSSSNPSVYSDTWVPVMITRTSTTTKMYTANGQVFSTTHAALSNIGTQQMNVYVSTYADLGPFALFNRELSQTEYTQLSRNYWQMFKPTQQRLWLGRDAGASSTVVTLPFIASESILFDSSLNLGTIGLESAYLDSISQVFTLSLSQPRGGDATLEAAFLSSNSQVFEPTLNTGSVSITIPVLGGTSQVFTPSLSSTNILTLPYTTSSSQIYPITLNIGNKVLTTHNISSSSQLYSITLNIGNIVVVAPSISSTSQVFSPTIGTGNLVLTAPSISSTSQLYSITLNRGSRTVTAPILASTSQVYSITLNKGGRVLTVPSIISTSQIYSIALNKGNIVLAAPSISSTSQIYSITLNLESMEPYSISFRYFALAVANNNLLIAATKNNIFQATSKDNVLAVLSSNTNVFSVPTKDTEITSPSRNSSIVPSFIRNSVFNTIAKVTSFFSPKRDI